MLDASRCLVLQVRFLESGSKCCKEDVSFVIRAIDIEIMIRLISNKFCSNGTDPENAKNEVTSAETAGKIINREKLESILFFSSYFKVTKH